MGKLRLLHIEDNVNDSELVQSRLQSEELEVELKRVHTPQEVLDAIALNNFDIILCDYSIPGYNGLSALKDVRRKNSVVPFIFVSGTIGETRAIEALKLGATDYILKDDLTRLAPAIKRAVREAEDAQKSKQMEHDLIESEKKFRNVYEFAPIGIANLSPEGRFIRCNPSLEKIFGYAESELRNLSFTDITHNEDCSPEPDFLGELSDGKKKFVKLEKRYIRKDGETVWCRVTASAIRNGDGKQWYTVTLVEDVTEQKKLEEGIRRAQKMESIGNLAGGIAHDFNNILTIILAYASVLQRKQMSPEKMRDAIGAVVNAAKRGSAVVKQMMTFSRRSEAQFESVALNSVVEDISNMVKATFPKTIEFSTHVDKNTPKIIADQDQLYQVFLNLCLNARDAMPNGGRLSIRTSIENGADLKSRFPEARNVRYVSIAVQDSGMGMNESMRSRIFEPFFTTKEVGKGTGLGLAVVYGVVSGHRGFIDVESHAGKGTTFMVYLPTTWSDAVETAQNEPQQSEIRGGSETVLVVEDEHSLQLVVKMSLEDKGYKVITTDDGAEALRVYSKGHKNIDLVLTDLGIPSLDGFSMFKQMKEINPKVKTVLASGFVEPEKRSEMLHAGIQYIISKPYVVEEVLRKVRSVLDVS